MLTDTKIRNAKPREKPYRLADSRGLYIEISPAGGRLWRFKYRYAGKEKRLALGSYPDVSLSLARERRDDARRLLYSGIDPSLQRKAEKAAGLDRAANSFEIVAREWYEKHSPTWAPSHAQRLLRRLDRDIFPWLGSTPIADVTAPQLLKALRRIEERGALETAHRALQSCSQIFRYAIATGRIERNPATDLKGALPPTNAEHFAAVTEVKDIGALLRSIYAYNRTPIVSAALKLAPLVFVRPGELRAAEWSHIDFEKAEWRFTSSKTKQEHIVPLSKQAIAILRDLQPLTGGGRYVFPSARSSRRPMSDMALLAAMRSSGITKDQMTVHGFRAMARTVLDEVLHFRPDFIEHQLAHAVRDPNGRSYNRTAHLLERKRMMQSWADFLDTTMKGAEIVELKRKN